MGENNEKINILDEMDKLVDRKLSEVKSVVPVILTIITAVITFLVSINVPKENELFWGFAILAIICSLMSFLYLLFAFYPVLRLKKSYKISADIDKKINSIKNKVSNSNTGLIPWNLKSYIKIPDEEFLVELEKYLQRDLTEDEKIKAKTIISTHLLQSAKYADREGLFDVFKLDLNTRKIKKGTEEYSSVYDSARAAGLDESIIKLAEKYASGQL